MKKLTYLLLFVFLVTACNNKNKQVSFELKKYEEQFTIDNNQETSLTAVIPIAEGNNEVSADINHIVFNTVKQTVGQENDSSLDYDKLFAGFIGYYKDFISDNPDYILPWEADIKGSINYSSTDIVNLKIESYIMTAGPHGIPNTTSLIFNTKNGKQLSTPELVKDVNKLAQIAEKLFREKNNIPNNESLNSFGYMFDNDQFILPQNIFINNNGLLLFYNVYEIAPYVNGTTELLIPYNDIKDILLIKI